MSRINFVPSWVEHGKSFITSGPGWFEPYLITSPYPRLLASWPNCYGITLKLLDQLLHTTTTFSVIISHDMVFISKIWNTFLFLFSSKMLVSMAGIDKMLVRKANREGPDQLVFIILEHLSYYVLQLWTWQTVQTLKRLIRSPLMQVWQAFAEKVLVKKNLIWECTDKTF